MISKATNLPTMMKWVGSTPAGFLTWTMENFNSTYFYQEFYDVFCRFDHKTVKHFQYCFFGLKNFIGDNLLLLFLKLEAMLLFKCLILFDSPVVPVSIFNVNS